MRLLLFRSDTYTYRTPCRKFTKIAFQIFLVGSLIAVSASESPKKLEKRGFLNDNGYSGGHATSVELSSEPVESVSRYLPPVAPVKKTYAVSSLPTSSYSVSASVPEHLPVSVPSQSYSVPSHSASYSVAESAPAYGLPVPSTVLLSLLHFHLTVLTPMHRCHLTVLLSLRRCHLTVLRYLHRCQLTVFQSLHRCQLTVHQSLHRCHLTAHRSLHTCHLTALMSLYHLRPMDSLAIRLEWHSTG